MRRFDDADQEVRFEAVNGLAVIAGGPDSGTSREAFLADPQHDIALWKDWAARRQQ